MTSADPSAALDELDGLLARAELDADPLDARTCARLVELCALVPGRGRRVVAVLARQRDAAAVDALLALPAGTGGVAESVFAALRRGVVRLRPDGQPFPHMLALEFRSSSSRRFPRLVARASAAFGEELERLRVADKLHYRVCLLGEPARLRERAPALELDIESLHRDLTRLRGVRLWLNGWTFDDHSGLGPRARAPLMRGWFEWVRDPSHAQRRGPQPR